MDDNTRKKILDWIYDNHMHHEGSDRTEMDIDGTVTYHKDEFVCSEGDSPYVNSLDLEKFIKEL